MNEELNTYDYSYEKGHKTPMDSFGILAMIDILTEFIEKEPSMFAPLFYAEKTEERRNENGDLLYVDTTWKEHTPDSFFMTSNMGEGGIQGLTPSAFKATQLKYALEMIHRQNIEKGEAKKKSELQTEETLNSL